MSAPLIAVCGLIYLGVAVDQTLRGNVGMAITYAAYALAKVGLYFVARG